MKNIINEEIQTAIKELNNQRMILHSTDTLPGIACDATSDNAIKKVTQIKNRKGPFSIILSSINQIERYACLDTFSIEIINKILPGPFTVLLKNNYKNKLSNLVTENSNFIGIRIPKHYFTIELSKIFKKPIITTSINLTSEKPLRNLNKIPNDFKNILVYNDKITRESKGSTILDISNQKITILRQGDGIYKK